MFSYDNVANHYKTNFALMHYHKYSLTELEALIPWEKLVYIDLLSEHIKKEEEDRRDREAAAKAQRSRRR